MDLETASGGLALLLTWSPWLAEIAEDGDEEDETGTLDEPDEEGETTGAGRASGIGGGPVRAVSEEGCSSVAVAVPVATVAETLGRGIGVTGRDSLTRAAFAAFSG